MVVSLVELHHRALREVAAFRQEGTTPNRNPVGASVRTAVARPEHPIQVLVSGNHDLDIWLRDAAKRADRAGTARVYVWLDDGGDVIGYIAILPRDIPSSIGRGAREVIPGFLVARLALLEHLHGRGRGAELLAAAMEMAFAAIHVGGGRIIVGDALDEHARGFYEHQKFRSLPDNPNRLVMKASTATAFAVARLALDLLGAEPPNVVTSFHAAVPSLASVM